MSDWVLWAIAGGILVLLAGSFVLAAAETAMTAAARSRLLQLETDGDPRAGIAARLVQSRARLAGALLFGTTLLGALATVLAATIGLALFDEPGILYAAGAMTVAIVVVSGVLPKALAAGGPERLAVALAPPTRILVAVLWPPARAIEIVVRLLLRLFGVHADEKAAALSAHEELRGAVDLQHREGGIVKVERDRIGGLLDLAGLDVADVMVHRTVMQSLDEAEPPERLVESVLKSPHTRLPLWRGQPENIVGVLHAKDLLRALAAVGGDVARLDLSTIATPPWFVPETTSLTDQLAAFLKRKSHFALVVDEYGEVQGLVTLEDILEEIVGDISDEHDLVGQGIRPQADGSVLVEGTVPIRDLNRALDWRLPDDEATTVAGLVIHEARMIPEERQAFTFHGFRFQVLRRERNRVALLRVTPLGVGTGAAATPTAAPPARGAG